MVGRADAPFRDGGTRCRDAPFPFDMRMKCLPERGNSHRNSPCRRVRIRSLAQGLAIALTLLLVACGGRAFDPTGPCTADGRAPGAYPELEALVRTTFSGREPDRLDSGRNCSDAALGTLKGAGISEIRFAGSTWNLGASSGVTIAVLEGEGLDAEEAAAFYEAGARAGRNVESVETQTVDVNGVSATRIDALNGESFQTVIVAPTDVPNLVKVVLVASFIREVQTREAHDSVVIDAMAAALGEPPG
jgi:hypothetical protein